MSTTTAEPQTTETDDTPAPPEPAAGEQAAAFDKSEYDSPALALPYVDDQPIDRIAVKFAGTIFLDRSDPNDIRLFRTLKLGRERDLKVTVRVGQNSGGWVTNQEGDLDVVVGTKSLKVIGLDIPAGDLDDE